MRELVEQIERRETAVWELEQLQMRRVAYRNQGVADEIERLKDELATLKNWLR